MNLTSLRAKYRDLNLKSYETLFESKPSWFGDLSGDLASGDLALETSKLFYKEKLNLIEQRLRSIRKGPKHKSERKALRQMQKEAWVALCKVRMENL